MAIIKLDAEGMPMPQVIIWGENVARYSQKKGLENVLRSDSFYLTSEGFSAEPDKMPLILVRICLASEHGKYVLLQTYFNKGDLSTIDLVALPLDYHREITEEYLKSILTEDFSRQPEFLLDLSNVPRSRYLTVGGWIGASESEVEFSGSSGDFGDQLSVYSANNIASCLLDLSKVNAQVRGDIKKGREYIERSLKVMGRYKLTEDFFSQLIEIYQLENIRSSKDVAAHILHSIILMKCIDQAVEEERDVFELLTLELAEGLGREMLVRGVAENLRKLA